MRINSLFVCDTNVLINIDLHVVFCLLNKNNINLHEVFRLFNKINIYINMIKYYIIKHATQLAHVT